MRPQKKEMLVEIGHCPASDQALNGVESEEPSLLCNYLAQNELCGLKKAESFCNKTLTLKID